MKKLKVNHKSTLASKEIAHFLKDYINKNTVIVCIGTDKCIGDCLGPLVGTFLTNSSFELPVYGTISSPIHALNLNTKISEILKNHKNSSIIGVDACLGDSSSIGEIHVRNIPIHPGKGVGKALPEVGDTSIIGIVDSSDNAEIFTSRSIRLNLIFDLANVISEGIISSYNLKFNKK
ncbi:spore protease YyaC [Clostridium fallax]|uniref:Putative sporulation protein YyaC n=1 Tax=Clostridium fallax TaxID=1533 RepID=A0A1M4VEH8_9CLOT|nr:spore protease YyaC [Clostridium fallax]SHE67351.1 putative sporulation protein YyaC [Clostridium fallax]SQB05756.1 putative sporulation protein YyaC [Clostridium fallax]